MGRQICLKDCYEEQGRHASLHDENVYMWWHPAGEKMGQLKQAGTAHMDDNAMGAKPVHPDEIHDRFERRFSNVTRQRMPFRPLWSSILNTKRRCI